MILINKNTLNKVALTLTEKQTISNPDYLFEFINDITGTIKIFSATDISTATSRYNYFNIIDNVIENEYNATMNFTPVGYWKYTIYEMEKTSPVDLNPSNALSVLETGKVLVKSIDIITATFDDNDTKQNAIFDL